MLNIDEIRAVTDKATAGPWENKTNAHPQCNGEPWGWIKGASGNICWGGYSGQTNGEFIARSRQWVPALCDEVEADRAEIAVLHRALHLMASDICDNIHRLQDEGIIKITRDSTAGQECAVYIQRAREEMEK